MLGRMLWAVAEQGEGGVGKAAQIEPVWCYHYSSLSGILKL